ncbi:hypothetical protein FACS189472_01020 [Alphaproteobacteria bacterium]|nr:hypothetical protein FACS189472_01020 [Alphaproteobacteria bacterium]
MRIHMLFGSAIALMLFFVQQFDLHATATKSKEETVTKESSSKKSKKKSSEKSPGANKSQKPDKKKSPANGSDEDILMKMESTVVPKEKIPAMPELNAKFGDKHFPIFYFLSKKADEIGNSSKKTLAFLDKDTSQKTKGAAKAVGEHFSLLSKQLRYATSHQKKKIVDFHSKIQDYEKKKMKGICDALTSFSASLETDDNDEIVIPIKDGEADKLTETVDGQLQKISTDAQNVAASADGAKAKESSDPAEDISSDISEMLAKTKTLKEAIKALQKTNKDRKAKKTKKKKNEAPKKKGSRKDSLKASTNGLKVLLESLEDLKKRIDIVIANAEKKSDDHAKNKEIAKKEQDVASIILEDLKIHSTFLEKLISSLRKIHNSVSANENKKTKDSASDNNSQKSDNSTDDSNEEDSGDEEEDDNEE